MTAFSNPNNYLILASDPSGSGNYFIHERETHSNGPPGKVVAMGDGKADVRQVAQTYIEDGFDPNKIIINGQPASDVFQKQGEQTVNKTTNEKMQNMGKVALLLSNPLVYMGLVATNPEFGLKLPNNNV